MSAIQPGSVRDDMMRGRSLHWFHWLIVGGILAVTLAAWRSSGHHPAILAAGVLFGGMLLTSFLQLARANRALRYADLASYELRLKNEMLAYARETALAANHSKDRFLASMSHDLRTPLNMVIGLTEAMLQCSRARRRCSRRSKTCSTWRGSMRRS